MLLADIFPGSFEQRASWQPCVGRALVLLLWLESWYQSSCCKCNKDLSSIYSSGMTVVGEVLYLSLTKQSRFSMMLLFMEAKNFK